MSYKFSDWLREIPGLLWGIKLGGRGSQEGNWGLQGVFRRYPHYLCHKFWPKVWWFSHQNLHLWHPLLLCFIIFSLTLCHIPLCLLIIRLIPFPWQCSPFVLLIHLFPWPTSFPQQSYQSFTPSLMLCSLLLFYLWFIHLWSFVTATLLYLSCIR